MKHIYLLITLFLSVSVLSCRSRQNHTYQSESAVRLAEITSTRQRLIFSDSTLVNTSISIDSAEIILALQQVDSLSGPRPARVRASGITISASGSNVVRTITTDTAATIISSASRTSSETTGRSDISPTTPIHLLPLLLAILIITLFVKKRHHT